MNRFPDSEMTPRRTPSGPPNNAIPVPGLAGQEVRRPQDPLFLVQVRIDLAVAIGVVAERDHVDAGGQHLAGDLRGDTHAAGGVLAVDDHEIGGKPVAQIGQERQQRALPDPADHVAHEQDADGSTHVFSALILPCAWP